MLEEDLEVAIKVVIVGNGAVGKSSIIQRYCKGIFTKDYKKTIGVDFLERQIDLNGEDVRLMLWDTAGQEEFDAITKAYYRGAQACLITFSTTDRKSFLDVKKWKKKVEDECGDIPMILVQNKVDLLDQSVVNSQELDALSQDLKLRLYKTSVKDNLNVNQVFHSLAEMYITRLKQLEGECELVPKTVGIGLFTNNSIVNGKRKKEGIITLEPLKRRTNATKQFLKTMCSIL